jgi:hypothetical protein
MGFLITCLNENCALKNTWAQNIVDLITNHRDTKGYFKCACGSNGYIEKNFKAQEKDGTWNPFLRGIIVLGVDDEYYQPFVYLVSTTPSGEIDATWFAYYKDTREEEGGRLKMGYGPG